MMFLLRARTCAYYKSFMFFAVTSVTAKGEGVCYLKENCWSCFDGNVPYFDENKPSFWLCGWVKRDYLLKCRRKWFTFSVLRT